MRLAAAPAPAGILEPAQAFVPSGSGYVGFDDPGAVVDAIRVVYAQ